MGLTIEQMQLNPKAREAAEQLLAACPWVVFTSGRRTPEEQASAMVGNIIRRTWVTDTYAPSLVSAEVQALVNTADAQLRLRLADLFSNMSTTELRALSLHIVGDAFDVQPIANGLQAEDTKSAIRALPGLRKFIEREGGLTRWHCEF